MIMKRSTVTMVARSAFADTGISDGPVSYGTCLRVLLRFVSILVGDVGDHLVPGKIWKPSITTGGGHSMDCH